MSVRNLHDDVWQIDIRIGRKDRFRKNVRASSKLQAVLIEQEYRKQLGREIGDIYSINSIAPEYLEDNRRIEEFVRRGSVSFVRK